MKNQNYCILPECGWTCNKPTHLLIIAGTIIAFPLLLIVFIVCKYLKTIN